jgi:ionotropic glutamate receptor
MYDAVVGDVMITTKRMEIVDFSQPYIESGLVVVVLARNLHSSNAWAFLRPFTTSMWLTTLAFFILTGMVVWILEHKKNRDFRGRPKKQVVTVLWWVTTKNPKICPLPSPLPISPSTLISLPFFFSFFYSITGA